MAKTAEENLYLEIGQGIKHAEESQMFGKPCFKFSKKAFICFFQSAMVFKLKGDIHAEALALEGSQLFDPSGKSRPMKEWVQVPFEHKVHWKRFATSAKDYIDYLLGQ